MGTLTRAQLRAQASLASGNDQSSTFLNTWLDAWLQRTAKSWAWPILKKQVVDLSAPASGAQVYGGVGYNTKILGVTALTNYIHRVFNPLFFYTSDKKQRGAVYINELIDGNVDINPNTTNVTDRLGAPSTCGIQMIGDGSVLISLNPVPDKQYYLSFWAHIIPNALASDASIPWYQSDRTLLQACKCALMEMDDGGEGSPALNQEMMKLSAMVVDDRDFDGEGPGDGQVMSLDKSVFL